ncbi:hypothetical protein FN960_15020 [Alkalicoccobacillus porphyridii]|uniref:Uncharacterized protein n=1 Tax=Alkalicoccobacillus porphyridii TaxID=2597270 RepID=A0A553ZWM7_9BACI|nr:hypothetical protein [Alkalicoccobacillus porphyridii]TSB45842.1 hypothetical protein FN960_15020 [Alkalicoccobacillus porphyridii]
MYLFIIMFAIFILYIINSMTDAFCSRREIPDEKQARVFRFTNICLTILLTSTYVKLFFT